MKKWFVWMFALFMVLFGSVFTFNSFKTHAIAKALSNMPEAEVPVSVMVVEGTTWNPFIETIGFVEPHRGVSVASVTPGRVDTISFSSGQKVNKGECLVGLESKVEYAKLRAIQAKIINARATYQRQVSLYKNKAAAKDSLDKAMAEYRSLSAEAESLRESIAQLQIKAPFPGVTGINQIQLGQYISPGTVITNLQDLSAMRVRFHISQADLRQIHLQQKMKLEFDAYPQEPFYGVITAIDPAVNARSGLIQVEAEIPNSEGRLRAGMFARVAIQLPPKSGQIVLPQTAIAFSLYGETVYKVQQDQNGVLRAKQVDLKVGERQNSLVLILQGVQVGDRIVTTGQVRLSSGTKIKIVETGQGLKSLTPLPML